MAVNRLESKGSARAMGKAAGVRGTGLASCPPRSQAPPDSSGVQPVVEFAGRGAPRGEKGVVPRRQGTDPPVGVPGREKRPQRYTWVVCVVPSCPVAAGKAMATGPCQ